jgi:hypothetical protein
MYRNLTKGSIYFLISSLFVSPRLREDPYDGGVVSASGQHKSCVAILDHVYEEGKSMCERGRRTKEISLKRKHEGKLTRLRLREIKEENISTHE